MSPNPAMNGNARSNGAPIEALELRNLSIYTSNTDAGLKLESVEVLLE